MEKSTVEESTPTSKVFGFRKIRQYALLALVVVMVACSWLKPLEHMANQQVDDGLKRALITFGTARAINAGISVVQGTSVAIQPVGIGVNLTIGQVLKPVNELVGQFANLMLAASVAFGVQKILLSIGAHWLISLLFTGIAAFWCYRTYRQENPSPWLSRLLVVMVMTRFAIPAVTVGSDMMFRQFMEHEYKSSQQAIGTTQEEIEKIYPSGVVASAKPAQADKHPETEPTQEPIAKTGSSTSASASVEEKTSIWAKMKNRVGLKEATAQPVPAAALAVNESPGFLDRFRGWTDQKMSAIKQNHERLKQSAEQAIGNIIKLMAIFLLQTIIIPLFLVWILYSLAKRSFVPVSE